MTKMMLVTGMTAVLVVAGAAQSEKNAVDPTWKVPEKAAQQKNPLATKPEAASGGRKLYARMCASCHGDESHGQTNNAPDLSSTSVQQESDGALFWRMSNGNSRRGMPSFSGLPEGQRWQLVLYIRSLGTEKMPAKTE